MNKSIFYVIATFLIFASCNTEEIPFYKTDEATAYEQPEKVRTLSLSANMPEESDKTTTRVAITQEEDKTIKLTWDEGDQLYLCFVQQETKMKQTVTVKNISADGKKASFDIILPNEINDGLFDLYGVYGGGGLLDSDPTMAKLPTFTKSTSSLNALAEGNLTMMHFSEKGLNTESLQTSVTFQHLGSLFCLTLKNSTSTSLDNLGEARLTSSTNGWAYNSAASGKSYNLASGQFQEAETAGDYISLYADASIETGDSLSFWGWYPPLPDINWPKLTLKLYDKNDVLIGTSSNTKPARNVATGAGKCFYFYAVNNDAGLHFTDNTFAMPLSIEDLSLTGDLRHADSGDDFIGMVYTKLGNVYYNQAMTSGVWSGEIDLGAGSDPRIAIDADNNRHVVFATTDNKIAYCKNNGAGFTTNYIETGNGGKCSRPDIAVDGSGFAHITYTDTRGGSDSDSYNEIMYAVNSSGEFTKTIIYDGKYYNRRGSYYDKGSRIEVDSNGKYFILTHYYDYENSTWGTYRSYSVIVASNTASGSSTSSSSDRHDIYDLAFDGSNVIALYKANNTVTTAKLTVGVDNKITFEDAEEVTSTLTNSFTNPATLLALPTTRMLGGISGGEVFMKHGNNEQIIDNSVKNGTVVVVTQCAEDVYVGYSGTDGVIRLVKQ